MMNLSKPSPLGTYLSIFPVIANNHGSREDARMLLQCRDSKLETLVSLEE